MEFELSATLRFNALMTARPMSTFAAVPEPMKFAMKMIIE